MTEPRPDLEPPAADLLERLIGGGIHGALEYLNSRTRHRFTGAYRFDGDMLRCYCLFDRENPACPIGPDVILRESYCGIIAADGGPLEFEDSSVDTVAKEHPGRKSTLAYQGVPLRRAGETVSFGTLCHWDVRPRLLTEGECEFMGAVAPIIARALQAEQEQKGGDTVLTPDDATQRALGSSHR